MVCADAVAKLPRLASHLLHAPCSIMSVKERHHDINRDASMTFIVLFINIFNLCVLCVLCGLIYHKNSRGSVILPVTAVAAAVAGLAR